MENENIKLDPTYVALVFIEMLFKEGFINKETYFEIVKNENSHN